MKNNDFIYFEGVKKVLGNYLFYPHIAKRKANNRISSTFWSVRYPNVEIKVLSTKLNPQERLSKKVVLLIKFNDIEINSWEDFIKNIKNIYYLNKYNKPYDTTTKLSNR